MLYSLKCLGSDRKWSRRLRAFPQENIPEGNRPDRGRASKVRGSTITVTPEEKYSFMCLVRGLEERLRAYYDQHQATGCECELCKNAELAFALLHGKALTPETFHWATGKWPKGVVPQNK